jgi:hypothetical protein
MKIFDSINECFREISQQVILAMIIIISKVKVTLIKHKQNRQNEYRSRIDRCRIKYFFFYF